MVTYFSLFRLCQDLLVLSETTLLSLETEASCNSVNRKVVASQKAFHGASRKIHCDVKLVKENNAMSFPFDESLICHVGKPMILN